MSKKRTVIVNLRIDQEDHNIIADIAQKEARPINNHYRMITGKWINENTDFESVFIQKYRQIDVSADIDAINTINVSIRIDERDYNVITELAKKEARSLTGQIRYMLRKYIELTGDVDKDDKCKDNWSDGF